MAHNRKKEHLKKSPAHGLRRCRQGHGIFWWHPHPLGYKLECDNHGGHILVYARWRWLARLRWRWATARSVRTA